MKKITTTLCLILYIVYGYGQNIVLLNDNKNVISNTTMDINIASSSSAAIEILVKNAALIPDTIKVIRSIYTIDTADQTQFCWGGLCYLYTTNISSLALTIAPGDTVNFAQDNGFHAIFSAGAACVTRLVHYKFYNTHNFSDSTGVTLRYLCATEVGELSKEGGMIGNAYPNPANSIVSIKYDVNESSTSKIIFYDMLGKSVKEIILNGKQGTAKINVGDLNAGIYFYKLMVDNKTIATKKMIINR